MGAAAPNPAAAVTGTLAPVVAGAPTPVGAVPETATPVVVAAPTPVAAVTGTLAPVAVEEALTPVAGAETLAPAQPVLGGEGEEEEEPTTMATFVTSDTPNGLCGEIQSLSVVTSSPLLVCYEETGHEYQEEGGHFFRGEIGFVVGRLVFHDLMLLAVDGCCLVRATDTAGKSVWGCCCFSPRLLYGFFSFLRCEWMLCGIPHGG